jgi:hypothetical protein
MKQSPLSLSRMLGAALILFSLATLFTGCSRSLSDDIAPNPTQTQTVRRVSVFLSDAPADFKNVILDVQKIEVKIDLDGTHQNDDTYGDNDEDLDDIEEVDAFGRWITLDFVPQQLDVLALRNGLERLLGRATIPYRVRKVRFTLGAKNMLTDGEDRRSRMTLVNETDNLLYVRVKSADMDLSTPGTVDLRVDFDLASSIIPVGEEYELHPKLRLFNLQTTGAVVGVITPFQVGARVIIEDGLGFVTGAIPDENGLFRVRGLQPGSIYRVTVTAPGYHDYEIRDVTVDGGGETQLSEINL